HTLALHAGSERVVEQFALRKPSMRIVVNTAAALGSVGMTTALFPAMTLGPGTLGGSIVSDNVSPLHLLNVKRVAFETSPVSVDGGRPRAGGGGWMDGVEARLREETGKAPATAPAKAPATAGAPVPAAPAPSALPLPEAEIERLIRRFR